MKRRRDIVVDGISRDDLTEERIEQLRREWSLPETFSLLTAEQREKSRTATLEPLGAGNDLWVFGYGSLMWNPAIHVAERRAGLVKGWHRRFCLWMPVGRGSPEAPGLMLGLDRGGSCRGILWRVAADQIDNETRILWRREMTAGGYHARWVTAHTDEGPIRAITFVVNRDYPAYARAITPEQTVHALAVARGPLGRARDYLHNTVAHLDELGLEDGPLHRLLAEVDAYARRDGGDS